MAYVYGHYKADTGELFYIGKGTGKRAWKFSPSKRSVYWKRVADKHGVNVKILADNLTEEAAYEKEKQLIMEIGLDKLVNILEGGEGSTVTSQQKLAQDPEWRKKMKENAQKRAQNPEWLHKMKENGAARLCKIHNDIYTFPNGRRTCRVCFRDKVKAWRHKNGIKPRTGCDCSYCSTKSKNDKT